MMQKLFILGFLVLTALQTPAPDDNGSLQGRVLLSGRTEPLSSARITLREIRPALPDSKPAEYSAMSDKDGSFLIKDLPPGDYTIISAAVGFVKSIVDDTPDQMSVSVRSRQEIKDLILVMAHETVVSGHLVDVNGRPVAGAHIEAQTVNGRVKANTSTDDDGEFKMTVLPGPMLIAADYEPPPAPPAQPESYARTYYPGVIGLRSAIQLDVREGDTTAGLDFRLQNMVKVTVSGTIVADPSPATGLIVGDVFLILRESGRSLREHGRQVPINVNPLDGHPAQFEFRDVQPGNYMLYAVNQADERARNLGQASIDVGTEDIRGLMIKPRPGVDVKGRIVTSSVLSPKDPTIVPVLESDESVLPARVRSALGLGNVEFDSSGEFTISNVPEGEFVVQAAGTRKGDVLLESSEGGRHLDGNILEISNRAPSPLQLTIGPGGTIRGTVIGSNRKPMSRTTVSLVPEKSRRHSVQLFQATFTDPDGNFELTDIPPGNYTLFAFENRPYPDLTQPDTIDRYESLGTAVSISAGTNAITSVPAIPN